MFGRSARCALLVLVVSIGSQWTGLMPLNGAATELTSAPTEWVATLLKADKEGMGQTEAAAAWQRVVSQGPDALSALFAAANGANPVALNWIVTAADRIVTDMMTSNKPLPVELFENTVKDRTAHPKIRWWCWQWLKAAAPDRSEKLLETALDDPAAELRRAAVDHRIAKLGDLDAIVKAPSDAPARQITVQRLQQLLHAARDQDQVERIADWLKRLGQAVDLAAHYGYVRAWLIVGPFDNSGDKGFDTAFPPEIDNSLAAAYPGKHGQVAWKKVVTADEHGRIDLNQYLGEEKAVAAYALAIVEVDRAQPAEIRWATPNATKLWVNGELVATYRVYHSGYEDDQYRVTCRLRAGQNRLLLKICQNEQTQDWARFWEFRLRVCDSLGGGIGRVVAPDNP